VRALQNTSLASSVCEVTSVNGASDAVRVLIVDDNDLFRETLGLNLVEEGYEVTSLSSWAAQSGSGVATLLACSLCWKSNWRISGE
jgi:hypothetical protein